MAEPSNEAVFSPQTLMLGEIHWHILREPGDRREVSATLKMSNYYEQNESFQTR